MKQIDIGTGISQYFVDEDGNVYWQYQSRFKLMEPRLNTSGYLYILVDGHKRLVHRLIAKAYLPNPYDKHDVNHLNGIRTDNRLVNLERATRSENMKHAYRDGKKYKHSGIENYNAKLKDYQVKEIIMRLKYGDTVSAIARDLPVGRTTVTSIKYGRIYLESIKRAAGIS